MIKNENYIQISGWMINDLHLSGNELMVYALIHGFSQDGKSVFKGSLTYIQEWLNCNSRQTVVNTIKSLIEKGMIEKRVVTKNKEKVGCEYWTIESRKKFEKTKDTGSPNFRPPESDPSPKNGLPLVQKLDDLSPKNGLPPSPNFRPNILNSNSKDIATVKNLMLKTSENTFGKNAFDETFPEKAADFLNSQGINEIEEYFGFIKNKIDAKNPENPRGLAYKLFFEIDVAQEFKDKQQQILEQRRKDSEIEARKTTCPVCDRRFIADGLNFCPGCDFPLDDFEDSERTAFFKKLMSLSPRKRQDYNREAASFKSDMPIIQRINYINSDEGKTERDKYIDELNKKYGIAV